VLRRTRQRPFALELQEEVWPQLESSGPEELALGESVALPGHLRRITPRRVDTRRSCETACHLPSGRVWKLALPRGGPVARAVLWAVSTFPEALA
jgi:hypothetical protein